MESTLEVGEVVEDVEGGGAKDSDSFGARDLAGLIRVQFDGEGGHAGGAEAEVPFAIERDVVGKTHRQHLIDAALCGVPVYQIGGGVFQHTRVVDQFEAMRKGSERQVTALSFGRKANHVPVCLVLQNAFQQRRGFFWENGVILQNQCEGLIVFKKFAEGFDVAEVATNHSFVGRFPGEDVEFSFVIFVDRQG